VPVAAESFLNRTCASRTRHGAYCNDRRCKGGFHIRALLRGTTCGSLLLGLGLLGWKPHGCQDVRPDRLLCMPCSKQDQLLSSEHTQCRPIWRWMLVSGTQTSAATFSAALPSPCPVCIAGRTQCPTLCTSEMLVVEKPECTTD